MVPSSKSFYTFKLDINAFAALLLKMDKQSNRYLKSKGDLSHQLVVILFFIGGVICGTALSAQFV